MKILTFLAFAAFAFVAVWAAAPPWDAVPIVIPLIAAAVVLAAPIAWTLTQLLAASARQSAAPTLRLKFPAPLTGEPPATAFA